MDLKDNDDAIMLLALFSCVAMHSFLSMLHSTKNKGQEDEFVEALQQIPRLSLDLAFLMMKELSKRLEEEK